MRDYADFYRYFMALSDPNRFTDAYTAQGLYGAAWPGMKRDAAGYLWPIDPTEETDEDGEPKIPEMIDYFAGRKKAQAEHIPYASEPGHMAMIDGKFQDVYLYRKEQERRRGIQASDEEQGGAINISPPTSVRLDFDLHNLMAMMQSNGRSGGM